MKSKNFLSKLWSRVADSQRNDVEFDRRLTVGSPSGFTINWTLKLVSVLVLVLTIGSGNVWGAIFTGDFTNGIPTGWSATGSKKTGYYQLGTTDNYIQTPTFSVAASGTITVKINAYVTGSSKSSSCSLIGYNASNEAVETKSVTCSSSSMTSSYPATTWTLTNSSNNIKYVKFVYTKATSSNMRVSAFEVTFPTTITLNANGGAANQSAKYNHEGTTCAAFTAVTRDGYNCTGYWTVSSGGTKILNANGSLAGANITVSTVPYTSSSKWVYADAGLTLYAQWESAGSSVALSKAATTNGSFTLSSDGPLNTTSAAQTITVTGSPNSGYYLSSVTQSGANAAPTITKTSATTYTIQYAQGCTGTSTISVTFSPIWYLKGDFNSWDTSDPLTNITSNVATVTKSLSKTTGYEFKVYNAQEDAWYGNNGKIIDDVSGWTFSTSEDNCKVFATVADDYTFKFNISTKAMQVQYPSMTHPNDAYVYLTKWWDCYVHYWYTDDKGDHPLINWGYDTQLSRYEEICETNYWCVPILDGYPSLIMKDNAGDPSNTTQNQTTTSNAGKYITHNGVSWGWHDFDTYTVSYAGGGGTGSMSSHTDLCPGANQALSANTFAKTHYTFAGWHADVDVKVGGSTITAGNMISNSVTLQDIRSNVNLTAQWTPNIYTITKTLTNVANAGLPASFTYTGATTTALNSTFTVDATNFFLPSSITVTMGGTPLTAGTDYTYNNSTGAFTFSAVITGNIVITATATAKLKSIAITTQPTTRKYFAGESFSSTGAVVTATMGDGSTKTVSATWTPSGALSAGTSQTVTASYTENGITKTATTTIDVYSVTVNKKNEDGDAIDVAGVTASWTVGTKALAAGVGSTKYAFKEWQVTGATPASTTSASTTLSSPTANVVVNAVFYKPRVIKWSVNGDDSYATGSPTTEVAYNGTISTVPTAPADNTLSCTNKFMGWSTKNAGTTPKTTSYYDDLFTNASGYTTNITAATTTFYAVFAEASDEINWAMGTIDQLSSGSGYSTYDGVHTVTGSDGNDYTYTSSNVMANSGNQFRGSSYCGRIYNTTSLGRITRIVLDYSAYAGQMKVYESDSEISSSGTTALTPTISDNRYTYECSGKGYFIVIQEGSNAAKANVTVYFGDAPSNYVTQCDANMVRVTYDANGGSTSCTNTTTDKTEDFTVCSTPPTRDYYTFAGWLCSADSKTYAASATIDDAVIDADFTLTAQWTPVTYNITYELDGGTNNVGNPATYNVTTATITLQDPTKGHDRFDGWYDNGSFTGDPITSIPLGSHGNITLYAQWVTRHEIIFDADGATTTIYRADDEDLSASVAGQGSVPSDPSAPTACSSKVFVGWLENTIDGETDTEPGDLMKPAAGTVDEDKHYYAVWAIESSESGTVYLYNGSFEQVTSGTEYGNKGKWTTSKVYGTGTAGEVRMSSGSASGSMDLDLSDKTLESTITVTFKLKRYGTETGSVTLSCMDDGSTASFGSSPFSYPTGDDNWHDCSSTVTSVNNAKTNSIHFTSTSGKRVYVKDVVVSQIGTVYNYSAYSTSCCATKVTMSDPSITGTGATITFDKVSPVATCDGNKTVTATVTVTEGYQVTALSFSGGSESVSPAISTPITSTTNYTLTFDEGTNATLTTTATAGAKPLNSITITPSSGEVYVGQYVDFTVSYDPADYISTGYTLNATPVYVTKVSATPANTKLRLKGGRSSGPGASITETVNETVTIKASGDNTKTASVNMTVNPLPRVHFVDLVHGKAFADVVATIAENALNPNKTTKTSVDWVTPNANTCEEQHLHLVGWIREDWPALVNYLNGTGDAPATTAIVSAGNDGSGNAYYIAAGASINVQTFDGVTFYAVWAEIK